MHLPMEEGREKSSTQQDSEITAQDERIDPNATILSHSVLSLLVPKVEYVQGSVKEITKTQNVLAKSVEQENEKFRQIGYIHDLSNTFIRCRRCRFKLVNIRREMLNLSDRMNKLKKRAARLKSIREKQQLKQAQEEAERQAYQASLLAKPAKHLTNQN
ncbi:uncharacterized protein TRIADDRAFT_60322 [Trichoplax adhaerens]|uniref:Biogenesis of lysosome-related organelles complex 1 subunit 6 n=1 Tax=Trichoplax adhaerens TaxID=10228 RepID=B3S7W7_TRIAD|nr:hypothetical protein TRIADDRAFT_60322 [Trichoplax adhaerens]EDV21262.1 hypothetical protein TRIADDRAFT_60322 [Trichoplax adhaerens]|eukprot:XP_002116229.1 hypothetical protein TRIADDRAFT_60322 [Trichoplax adhaerens]